MNRYDVFEEMLHEITRLMEDVYQSGFDTVHDATLDELTKAKDACVQYGLDDLAERLKALTQGLISRRHRLKKERDGLACEFANINEYLYLCGQKIAYDRAAEYYKGKEENGQ